MNLCWSLYRLDTGEFTGRQFSGPENALGINTPSGCGAVQGRYDKYTQRVDVRNGLVVERERPEAELEEELRQQRMAVVQAHIRELEQRQHRRVRELLAESDPMLKGLADQIEALRAELSPPPVPAESSGSVRPAAELPREA